jgi:hypothetical protein
MNRFLISLLFALVVVSCSPNINSDNERPIIENLEIANLDSVNHIVFPVKTNVQFSASFIDDEDLGSYKFDIHFAGDGHKHTHIDAKKAVASTSQWNFSKNGEISGTEKRITFTKKIEFKDDDGRVLDVVANSGPYHCVVYSVDKAGNSASFIQSNFIISNEDMPTYTITEPDFTDYKVAAGGTIILKGTVYGKKGLSKLAYIIRSIDDEEADDLLDESVLIEGDVKEETIDISMKIPTTALPGKYAMILLASDKAGNVGENFEVFEITN